jgi:hypothetical protein
LILDNLQLLNDSLRQAEKVAISYDRALHIVQSSPVHKWLQVHKELVAGKAKLEYSVHVKTHSLLIDLTKCLPARKVGCPAACSPPCRQAYPMKLRGEWQTVLDQVSWADRTGMTCSPPRCRRMRRRQRKSRAAEALVIPSNVDIPSFSNYFFWLFFFAVKVRPSPDPAAAGWEPFGESKLLSLVSLWPSQFRINATPHAPSTHSRENRAIPALLTMRSSSLQPVAIYSLSRIRPSEQQIINIS